jgi:hypothetical protein
MATRKNYRVNARWDWFTQSDRSNSTKPKPKGNSKVTITAKATGVQAKIMSASERIRKENLNRRNWAGWEKLNE